jgi:hypothetical protein
VLTPWRPFQPAPDAAARRRVIHTVSRPDDLPRCSTRSPARGSCSSARPACAPRHDRPELWRGRRARRAAGSRASRCTCRCAAGPPAEVERLLTDVVAAGAAATTVWVSHLTAPS